MTAYFIYFELKKEVEKHNIQYDEKRGIDKKRNIYIREIRGKMSPWNFFHLILLLNRLAF